MDARSTPFIEKHKRCTALKLLRFKRSLLIFLNKRRTAPCQSLGEIENRNKTVNNDVIAGAEAKPTAARARAKPTAARAKHGKSKRRGDATTLDETMYVRLNAAAFGHVPMMQRL